MGSCSSKVTPMPPRKPRIRANKISLSQISSFELAKMINMSMLLNIQQQLNTPTNTETNSSFNGSPLNSIVR